MTRKRKSLVKFEVKTGVPIPFANTGGGAKYDWPFGTMKVGQCFFIPCKDIYDANHHIRPLVYRAAAMWRVTGRRFETRLMDADKSIGVWRVA